MPQRPRTRAVPARRRGATRRGALLALVAGLALALGALELVLRLRPGLLPKWYRETFPFGAVELFHPGILAATPVEGVPLPLPTEAYAGVPPADLALAGVAPADADHDGRRFPDVRIPADARGLPNPRALERADLVLLGDSFAVGAGVESPPGLRRRLEERTGLSVYDVAVAGIGPIQEEWLLRELALGLEPRAVVWLFYSGNDVTYSIEPLVYRRQGWSTFAEAHAKRLRPRSYVLDLAGRWLARGRAAPAQPLPPFRLPAPDGGSQPVWFLPENLVDLGFTVDEWRAHPGWPAAAEALLAGVRACRERGVVPLLVYLPSKCEVLLPLVERDAALVARAVGDATPFAGSPEELLDHLLLLRGAREELFLELCRANDVACLSARPALEELARTGEPGYLVTDTHWSPFGQGALLEPLVELLEAEGVLGADRVPR